jgi:hypothetical protein
MSRSYTSSPPSASMTCSGTALLYPQHHTKPIKQFMCKMQSYGQLQQLIYVYSYTWALKAYAECGDLKR